MANVNNEDGTLAIIETLKERLRKYLARVGLTETDGIDRVGFGLSIEGMKIEAQWFGERDVNPHPSGSASARSAQAIDREANARLLWHIVDFTLQDQPANSVMMNFEELVTDYSEGRRNLTELSDDLKLKRVAAKYG